MWLKKMNFNVFILKNGMFRSFKIKIKDSIINQKEETLDILNINELMTFKKCTFFDIRLSQDYLNVRLKNSLWLNRSEIFKKKYR